MPMRSIIDSIRSGERAPDVLVWWAGATDWMPFSSDRELFELLQALPATNQPPPPPPMDVAETLAAAEFSGAAHDLAFSSDEIDDIAEQDTKFPEPEVTTFSIWPEDETLEDELSEPETDDADKDLDGPVNGFALELGEPHPLDEFDDVDELDQEDEDEIDALFNAGPRAMHPSTGWGIDGDALEQPPTQEFIVEEADDVEVDDIAASDEADEADEADQGAQPDDAPGRLTGLFGAPGLRVQPGDVSEPLDSGLSQEAISARQMLQNVGARIDALSSSTRRAREFELEETTARASTQVLEESTTDEEVESTDLEPAESESESESVAPAESAAGSWQAVEGTTGLDERFAEMVERSAIHKRRLDWALRVEELLLSASITVVVDKGFVLADLDTHDTLQRATFDHNEDARQIRLELSPLSPVNAAGDPVDRLVKVSMAWTQKVENADNAFATVRAEVSDDAPAPGEIRCEANMVASSASTMVDLVWGAREFVKEDHRVDRANLELSLTAIVQTLESRWYELFTPAR